MIRFVVAIVLAAQLALQACGQTGDLYWPADEQVEIDDDENDDGAT